MISVIWEWLSGLRQRPEKPKALWARGFESLFLRNLGASKDAPLPDVEEPTSGRTGQTLRPVIL